MTTQYVFKKSSLDLLFESHRIKEEEEIRKKKNQKETNERVNEVEKLTQQIMN